MTQLSDAEVLVLYRQWCEEYWRAGFLHPAEHYVAAFRAWIAKRSPKGPAEGFEGDVLAEYRRQEAEE
jgi:hypothetical protein